MGGAQIMFEKLAELKEKSKGTLFEETVSSQIENYKKLKQKEIKITQINNKWIDQADELFNLYEKICQVYVTQIESFVEKATFVDKREEDGRVMLSITDFKGVTFSLQCADWHSLDDYQKLAETSFVDTLDEHSEEGGVQFYFYPDKTVAKVKHSQIFNNHQPIENLQEIVKPFILELFQQAFDIESLMSFVTDREKK